MLTMEVKELLELSEERTLAVIQSEIKAVELELKIAKRVKEVAPIGGLLEDANISHLNNRLFVLYLQSAFTYH